MRTIWALLITVLFCGCATYEPHIPYASLFKDEDQHITSSDPTVRIEGTLVTELYQANTIGLSEALQAGRPISIFAAPTSSPTVFKPVALVTERMMIPMMIPFQRLIIPFPNDTSVLHRFGTASIPVHHVVLLPQPPAIVGFPRQPPVVLEPQAPALLNPHLLQNIADSSVRQIHIDVNPEFAAKLAWEGTKLVLWSVPIAGPLTVGRLMDIVKVGTVWQQSGLEGAAKTGLSISIAMGTEKIVGRVLISDMPLAHYVGVGVGKYAEKRLGAPQMFHPTYAYKVTDVSNGTVSMPHMTLRFESRQLNTYRGLSPTEGWTSNRITTITQTSGPSYTLQSQNLIRQNPVLYPPVTLGTLRPIEHLSPDITGTLAPPVQWNRFSNIIGPTTLSPDVSRMLLPDLNWTRSILQQPIRMPNKGY